MTPRTIRLRLAVIVGEQIKPQDKTKGKWVTNPSSAPEAFAKAKSAKSANPVHPVHPAEKTPMHPRTIRLHLALIKLAKGVIRAWEDWIQDH